jgi:hypothetical protein
LFKRQLSVSNCFVRYEHGKSIQQNVRFECQTISENIQKLKQEIILLYQFKDIQGLEFLFSNSRTFKDFQILYEPCGAYPHYLHFIFDGNFHSTLIWRSRGIFI